MLLIESNKTKLETEIREKIIDEYKRVRHTGVIINEEIKRDIIDKIRQEYKNNR